MYKAKELREQTIEELKVSCEEARRKLFAYYNQARAQKKYDKPHEAKQLRKDIARLLTVMTEKKLQSQTPSSS